MTSTRSSSATGTGMVTSTGTAGSSSGATGSAGSTSRTGAAVQSTAGANVYYRDGMGAMGAAAIALVGAVAAL